MTLIGASGAAAEVDYDELYSSSFKSITTPLSGKHLIISALSNVFNFYVMRNSSGYVTLISGVGGRMIEWLSIFHNFTYSPLQVGELGFDNVKTGLVGFLLRGECDIVGSVIPTPFRVLLVDFTHPALYNPAYFMIPVAKSSNNLLAPVLPFQAPVWIGIASAMLIVLASLHFFNYWYFQTSKVSKDSSGNGVLESKDLHQKRATAYVIGLLLDQGGQNLNRKLPILFIGAAWCLSTLVLINVYTSLLTSYMTAPNPQPLVKSAQDLRDRSDVWIVTDKDRNSEALLLAAESGLFKDLGDKLRAYPHSSCKRTSDCADLVKSGSHAYVSTRDPFLLKAMLDDFKATGKCNMELGGVELFMIQSAWTLVKRSPYTPYINYGIMRMRDTGHVTGWMRQFKPDVRQCTEKNKKKGGDDSIVQLSLGHLFGAFVALFTGYAASLLVFVTERIVFTLKK